MHFTAHTHYRSVIIDLYALFGPANNNNKYSFLQIDQRYTEHLRPGSIEAVYELIQNAKADIDIVRDLRHKEIAHYDFIDKEFISLNFKNLFRLNKLFELTKGILSFYGNSFLDEELWIGNVFERKHSYLEALEMLVSKAP